MFAAAFNSMKSKFLFLILKKLFLFTVSWKIIQYYKSYTGYLIVALSDHLK